MKLLFCVVIFFLINAPLCAQDKNAELTDDQIAAFNLKSQFLNERSGMLIKDLSELIEQKELINKKLAAIPAKDSKASDPKADQLAKALAAEYKNLGLRQKSALGMMEENATLREKIEAELKGGMEALRKEVNMLRVSFVDIRRRNESLLVDMARLQKEKEELVEEFKNRRDRLERADLANGMGDEAVEKRDITCYLDEVRVYMKYGAYQRALQLAEAVATADPDNPEARDLVGELNELILIKNKRRVDGKNND